ncbi:holo-[acyl-carrier-protein] synthase [Chitinophaga costaii]|uniref:Holo-[acyl-carrier-protein] synthase n=1 Tax=Chitinophaga costaii TaxID=1335309 RepID=A0A1C3ZGM6_9BACT|nr:holo-ACP synthase [Chitinophaga costaii]PUZ30362.1 holo-[acyl-carrier-protein] synthase [Chitinophaga costaii]SCB81436.1 holo-[acyl-carrier-protein] synthase [Chitinophaga costaii]
MIKGIGTDIVDVARIQLKIQQGRGFREWVFSPLEIAYCEKQAQPAQSYAARFAAKEALLKALGTGWGESGLQFHEIEVRNDLAGKPSLHLLGHGATAYTNFILHVSLSHTATLATATVLVEEN